MNILLIIIVVLFLLAVFNGYRNGFLRTIFALATWFIIFFVTKEVAPLVTDTVMENTGIVESVEEAVAEGIGKMIAEAYQGVGIEKLEESMPELMEMLGWQDIDIEQFVEEQATQGVSQELTENVRVVIRGVIGVVVVLAVVLICKVALSIFSIIFSITDKLPIIGSLDKFLGLVCGVGNGLIWSWIVLTVVSMLAWTGMNTEFVTYISDSPLLTWLQENNILLKVVSALK